MTGAGLCPFPPQRAHFIPLHYWIAEIGTRRKWLEPKVTEACATRMGATSVSRIYMASCAQQRQGGLRAAALVNICARPMRQPAHENTRRVCACACCMGGAPFSFYHSSAQPMSPRAQSSTRHTEPHALRPHLPAKSARGAYDARDTQRQAAARAR